MSLIDRWSLYRDGCCKRFYSILLNWSYLVHNGDSGSTKWSMPHSITLWETFITFPKIVSFLWKNINLCNLIFIVIHCFTQVWGIKWYASEIHRNTIILSCCNSLYSIKLCQNINSDCKKVFRSNSQSVVSLWHDGLMIVT